MNTPSVSLFLSAILAFFLASSAPMGAADAAPKSADPAKPAATEAPKPKRDWYPFFGYVASVDKAAKTVTLKRSKGERVLKTDAKTQIEVDDKPAGLGDIKVGSYAHGRLHRDGTGAETILSAKFDPHGPTKPATPAAPAAPEKTAPEKKPAR